MPLLLFANLCAFVSLCPIVIAASSQALTDTPESHPSPSASVSDSFFLNLFVISPSSEMLSFSYIGALSLAVLYSLFFSATSFSLCQKLDCINPKFNFGLDHLFGQHSVKREFLDGLICDESIALAMVEEKSGSDGDSQLTEC